MTSPDVASRETPTEHWPTPGTQDAWGVINGLRRRTLAPAMRTVAICDHWGSDGRMPHDGSAHS